MRRRQEKVNDHGPASAGPFPFLMDLNGKTGIGFRRDFSEEFLHGNTLRPHFVELAPENWMRIGGHWGQVLDEVRSRYPILCHGLSLSIGSPEEPDPVFLRDLKEFLDRYEVVLYSEHLSYSKCHNAHLYDLLPIPFRQDAVRHIAERIRKVQDFLGRQLVIENVSYYTPVAAEMTELEFITAILEEADCKLLMDVNNVYVNAFNHKYDPVEFLRGLPAERVAYMHMAGHEQVAPDLIIDTHGSPIIDPVYRLFETALDHVPPVPVLLERDFNIPELPELQTELDQLQKLCNNHWFIEEPLPHA